MDISEKQVAFGWDLAGYGSKSPICVAVQEPGKVHASIIRYRSLCSPGLELSHDLGAVVAEERQLLERCCRVGPFFVDVPIDLQCLRTVLDRKSPLEVSQYWQLVMRPIDFALSGLTPLADNIGYPVARLANVLGGLKGNTTVVLGETLFETYPAASLDYLKETCPPLKYVFDKHRFRKSLLATKNKNWPDWVQSYVAGLPEDIRKDEKKVVSNVVQALDANVGNTSDGRLGDFRTAFEKHRSSIKRQDKPPYKTGVATWNQDRWDGTGKAEHGAALADLMNALGIIPAGPELSEITADDFDAVICSLGGIFRQCCLPNERLENAVRSKIAFECGCDLVPQGYRILNRLPEKLQISLNVEPLVTFEAVCSFVEGLIDPDPTPATLRREVV